MSIDQPGITMEPHRVICKLHGEPFRANWPAGYVPFLLFALDKVMGQEEFVAYAGGEVAKVNALLDERPLCCRLSPDDRLEAWSKTGLGQRGFCRVCRQPANVVTIPIGAGGLPHAVCFICMDKLEVRSRHGGGA